MTVSPLEPLSSILVAPVTVDDLADIDVDCKYDDQLLEEFEDAWKQFLLQQPDSTLPRGEREQRIIELQTKAKEIELSKNNVEIELKKQATFFRSSREELEKSYSIKLQEAMDQQRSVHEGLSKKLEAIAVAEKSQQETLPWIHFIKELDSLIATDSQSTNSSDKSNKGTNTANKAKPSSRATFLADATFSKSVSSPSKITNDEQSLRAYRIDHAFLKANVSMIQKEIGRYEKLLEVQPSIGDFLTEHNVWDLLKANDASTIANTTVSTVTLPPPITSSSIRNGTSNME